MISTVMRDIGGRTIAFKFSTRAQARVERQLGESIAHILSSLGDRHGIDAVCEILAASWNDGKGHSVDRVYDVIDEIGQRDAGQLVAELVAAAFPDQKDDAEGHSAPKK